MKKVLKTILLLFLSLVAIVAIIVAAYYIKYKIKYQINYNKVLEYYNGICEYVEENQDAFAEFSECLCQ